MKKYAFNPLLVLSERVGALVKKYSLLRQKKITPEECEAAYVRAQEELQDRRQRSFKPKYPDLPISQRLDELRQALLEHPVVIVEGETGSGKTTQIPKLCLELGLSERGLIACTQPRRIAATSICTRLREELEDEGLVGAKIRFYEDLPPAMRLQVMTDGVLLQEYRNDPWLSKYTCIILDEAHERSLNMDLLLGIFKVLRERRPDLKFVVTSATMDAEMFSKFFDGAPVIKVEGRTFPVDIRYAEDVDDLNLDEKATAAILALMSERPDHLLCFLPTERDILETKQLLLAQTDRFEVLPLFARMPQAEQKKVFAPSSKPKVILSTNVAETSLTIPGIAYVVDTGLARVLRYQPQSRIQALPLERISKASAGQRAGRAGRVKAGVCIRLYSAEDFDTRTDYTDPEILRSSLDNVVLQLRQLNLDPEEFPFVQAPVRTALKGAASHLWEIGALSDPIPQADLTSLGRRMVGLPLDAVLARILIQAFDHGMVLPVAVVCAALSLSELRLNPQDPAEKNQAEIAHRLFKGPGSDFYMWLRLWNTFWQAAEGRATRNRIRNFCKKHWISFQRMSEWIDLVEQFLDLLKVKNVDYAFDLEKLHADEFHQCLLSGLVAGVARKEPQNHSYRLNGGKEAFLVSQSALFKKKPEWVLSANIRETQRVYLTANAEISALWVYKLFPQLCKKSYHNPEYNPKTGFVEAIEEVRFRNFVLSRGKRVSYERIDAEQSAQIFLEDGMASFALPKTLPVMEENARLLQWVKALESKLRLRGLVPSREELAQVFGARMSGICHFKDLQKKIQSQGEDFLRLRLQDLVEERKWEKMKVWMEEGESLEAFVERMFPSSVQCFGDRAELEALLDPGNPLDGIVLKLPKRAWQKFSPSAWALALPVWPLWIWNKVLQNNSKECSTWLEQNQKELLALWFKALQSSKAESPLLSLWEVLRPKMAEAELRFVLPKSWEKWEHLHLVDGEQVLDLAPHFSDFALQEKISQYFYRREHRGKVDLLDYDRVVLGSEPLWRAPCVGSQGPEIRNFNDPGSAELELQKLRMEQPLKRLYPQCLNLVESWVHSLLRQIADRLGRAELVKEIQSTVVHAFVVSLPEEERQFFKEIPPAWKEGFRIPKLRSGPAQKSKGLDSLAALSKSQVNAPERILSWILFYGLCAGPKIQALWWEWLKMLDSAPSKEMANFLSKIELHLSPSELGQRSGLCYALALDFAGLRAQPKASALGNYDADLLLAWEEELNQKMQSHSRELRKLREEFRLRLLPFDGFLEDKQKIQAALSDLEKKTWNADVQKALLEIREKVCEVEMMALRRGVDLGDSKRRPLQKASASAAQDFEQPSQAPTNDALAKLKSMFGKVN